MKNPATYTIVGLVVTLVILFGGFFGYQYYYVEQPLKEAMQQSHLKIKKLEVEPTSVYIEATPNESFHYTQDYPELMDQLDQIADSRKVEIQLQDSKDANLEHAWEQMTFGIREGIDKKEYTKIQQTVSSEAKKANYQYEIKMDKETIYIELRNGNKVLYRTLEVPSAQSEVKTHD